MMDKRQGKTLGFLLLALSVLSVVAAAVLGVTAATEQWDPQRILGATATLAAFAEVTFWLGSGLVGLSMVRERKLALGRIAFWRKD